MKVQLRVHVKVYINTHSGYCSGNECSYADIDEYRFFIADVDPKALSVLRNEMFYKQLSEIEDSYDGCKFGSYYCENDPEANEKGIGKHAVELEFSDVELDSMD